MKLLKQNNNQIVSPKILLKQIKETQFSKNQKITQKKQGMIYPIKNKEL
jgi:hypothetical protein